MAQSSIKKFVAARYASRFTCIGPACEDNCCHGWKVAVDEPHYYQLRRTMNGTRAEREEFRASHVRNADPAHTSQTFAYLATDATGCCTRLSADGHCATQSRYGADALSDTCATYPREISVVRDRVEMLATLSCPETARQCLLRYDALDFDEIDPARIPRLQLRRALPIAGSAAPADAYGSYLDDLRVAFFQLLSLRRYPLSSRLFFLVQLAEETRPFFRRGAPVDEKRLADTLRGMSTLSRLDGLHREFAPLGCPRQVAASMLIPLLNKRLSSAAITPFHRLVAHALGADRSAHPEDVLAGYERRRDYWQDRYSERIENYFVNYAISYFLKEWYSGAPDLLTHVLGFAVRYALVRLLLFSHPRLRTLMEEPDAAVVEAGLDAAVVETVYSFSRVIEHDASFKESIDAILSARDLHSAAHAACLAKF